MKVKTLIFLFNLKKKIFFLNQGEICLYPSKGHILPVARFCQFLQSLIYLFIFNYSSIFYIDKSFCYEDQHEEFKIHPILILFFLIASFLAIFSTENDINLTSIRFYY